LKIDDEAILGTRVKFDVVAYGPYDHLPTVGRLACVGLRENGEMPLVVLLKNERRPLGRVAPGGEIAARFRNIEARERATEERQLQFRQLALRIHQCRQDLKGRLVGGKARPQAERMKWHEPACFRSFVCFGGLLYTVGEQCLESRDSPKVGIRQANSL